MKGSFQPALFKELSDEVCLTANGDRNKLSKTDRPVHDWYRFVLSFPPHLVRKYLGHFKISQGQTVLDPFCGTGTTLVECKKLGIQGIGIEANPMAFFASKVKTDWSPDPGKLLEEAWSIARQAEAGLDALDLPERPMAGSSEGKTKGHRLLSLPPEAEELLLSGSISPVPLHKTLLVLKCIREISNSRYRSHHMLALAKALVTTIGNLHFGPEVGVGPRKKDAPVVSSWLENVASMAAGIREVDGNPEVSSRVFRADARKLSETLGPDCVDAVITSPPYPNEKDYTRTTRLESVILGLINDKAELRKFKQNLVRSNTRNVFKGDDDDAWISDLPEVLGLAQKIENRRVEMGKTSGFEKMYHRVTRLYFGGMARHLSELRGCLRKGARLAYVVGDQASFLRVMIRTGKILADIAARCGYEVEGIDLFRTRLATATREQLREEVVLLRWPG